MRGRQISVHDYYDGLVRDRAIHSLVTIHRTLTKSIALSLTEGEEHFEGWAARHQDAITQLRLKFDTLLSTGMSLSKLLVAINMLDDFVTHLSVDFSPTQAILSPPA